MANNTIPLPNEILILILKRLSPKALIKTLTVSKSWYTLITSPNFISSHLKHHKNLSFFNHFFIPLNSPISYDSISTSVNGLLCLLNSNTQNLCLWNPAINKFLQIEIPLKLSVSSFRTFALGFGYNPFNEDYKVVLIDYDVNFVFLGDNDIALDSLPRAEVYSVNGGVNLGWKRVLFPDNFPLFDVWHFSESCYANNFIHWIVFMRKNDPVIGKGALILTFDPRNDCFGEIKLPKLLVDQTMCLATMNASLVLIRLVECEESTSGDRSAIVWMMEEYGVVESWKMVYRIKVPCLVSLNPKVWDEEDGRVFIATSAGTLIVFNVQNGSSSDFDGEVAMLHGQAFGYTESLVLLDRFRRASWLQREHLPW